MHLNISIFVFLVALLSSPPTNIQGTVLQTLVMLIWTQPDIDAVQNYIISYTRTAGCSDAPSGSQTTSGSMRMYTLSGLQENITYDITIAAMNTRNRLSATESLSWTTLTLIEARGFVSNYTVILNVHSNLIIITKNFSATNTF